MATCIAQAVAAGSVISITTGVVDGLHELASVTIKLYVPAAKPEISSVVAVNKFGPVQLYVYGETPLLTVILISPVLAPLHNILFCV